MTVDQAFQFRVEPFGFGERLLSFRVRNNVDIASVLTMGTGRWMTGLVYQ